MRIKGNLFPKSLLSIFAFTEADKSPASLLSPFSYLPCTAIPTPKTFPWVILSFSMYCFFLASVFVYTVLEGIAFD
jgi:hypothetical protein